MVKTLQELNTMTKKELTAHILQIQGENERNEIRAMSERTILQRMNTFFLNNMKRVNHSKIRIKGKKPAKYLKWFNSEER
jgi:hypothetical protein